MRNNQPVTGHEYEFPSSHMLVSATDLTGRIQYCNPAFIAVSGYTREELIGQPSRCGRYPRLMQRRLRRITQRPNSGATLRTKLRTKSSRKN